MFRIFVLFAALAALANAQHRGEPPPALVWGKLKGNCPANLDQPSLRGKVIVVSMTEDDVSPEDIDDQNDLAAPFEYGPVVENPRRRRFGVPA